MVVDAPGSGRENVEGVEDAREVGPIGKGPLVHIPRPHHLPQFGSPLRLEFGHRPTAPAHRSSWVLSCLSLACVKGATPSLFVPACKEGSPVCPLPSGLHLSVASHICYISPHACACVHEYLAGAGLTSAGEDLTSGEGCIRADLTGGEYG